MDNDSLPATTASGEKIKAIAVDPESSSLESFASDEDDNIDDIERGEFNVIDHFQNLKPVEFSSSSEEEHQDFEDFAVDNQGQSFVDFSRGIYEIQQRQLMDSDERPRFSCLSDIIERSDEYREVNSPESIPNGGFFRNPGELESGEFFSPEEGAYLLDDISDTHSPLHHRSVRSIMSSDGALSSTELDRFARERHQIGQVNGTKEQEGTEEKEEEDKREKKGEAVQLKHRKTEQSLALGPDTAPRKLRMPIIRKLERLKVDRTISVQGMVDKDARDFSICLQTSSSSMPHTDVVLLVKACFHETGCVIMCNSFLYESWGTPTAFRPHDLFTKTFPFSKGESFHMLIAVKAANYEIIVDDQSVLAFDHRVSPEKASYIRVEGDVRLEYLECPRMHKLPYIMDVPQGLRSGQVLVVDTFIKPLTKSFQMHLTAKHQDIYAGFYTSVSFEGVITKVKCQGFLNEKKDEEVTIDGHLPIFRNRELELKVVIGQHRIELLLDGEWFADYDHKLPIEKLNSLTLDGDIALYEATIHKPRGYLSLAHHKSRCCECCVM